ncbi:hypothetical protein CBP51_04790 [Cellvibrio mixtus]|jgi:hypothetical protein|uniref:DUF3014 domain-containing protein n=1 Tax=Cellvibrio mixtus TaxID=39650 RepID=A0A266Q911_9GAMM|nr:MULTISPECIES: DUF3014 domain-containing protein [Cellvibrio]AQT60298.1 hypothetical protein B0D95_09465 [Cellvibrio sp. PSBB023]OZY86348.1 hypothetical protein CBP51_04790 [Cellvibrio mixtus]
MSDDYPPRQKSSSTAMIVVVVIALIALGLAFMYLRDDAPASTPVVATPIATAPESVTSSSAPAEQAPIEEYQPPAQVIEVEPLPALGESDSSVLAALTQLRGEGLIELLVPQELIRKFVLAVNNLSEGKVIHEYRPVISPPPPFIVDSFTVMIEGEAVEQERVSANNYQRYETYVTTLALIDSDAAVAVYRRFYPLLEEAFRELGLKKPNFHSVLIAAIDNILAAPDAQGDLLLVRPKVFYQYADPALEQLPQTHKLMLRMGPENARSVKASLRQLRARLITQ